MEPNHSQYNQYHHSPYHHTPFSVFNNTTIFSFIFLTLTFSIGMEEQGWICGTRLAEYSVLMLDLSTIVCHVLNHIKPYQRYSRSYNIMPQIHHTIYVPNHAILYNVTWVFSDAHFHSGTYVGTAYKPYRMPIQLGCEISWGTNWKRDWGRYTYL